MPHIFKELESMLYYIDLFSIPYKWITGNHLWENIFVSPFPCSHGKFFPLIGKDNRRNCPIRKAQILKRSWSLCLCVYAAAAAKLLQSCLTLCNSIDSSPPGTSVHGIFQARVLEWVSIAFSITSMWECNSVVVWTSFGIAFLWDWNENWPFPVLRPLLSFLNLMTYSVQHFHSGIF